MPLACRVVQCSHVDIRIGVEPRTVNSYAYYLELPPKVLGTNITFCCDMLFQLAICTGDSINSDHYEMLCQGSQGLVFCTNMLDL